jgi:hypothetical protein
MKPRYLTKSRFKLALDCPRKLYYTDKPQYENSQESDDFLMALAEGGFQVGALAKLYSPGGHDITERGYEVPLQRTYELLKQENVIIYEAAIKFKNLFIRIDVLEKTGNYIKLIEVKSKSFSGGDESVFLTSDGHIAGGWDGYLYDVAFQKYVLANAFPEFQIDCYLMLADKTKAATVTGLNQKFQLVSADNERTSVKLLGDTSLETLGEPILTAVKVTEIIEKIHSGTYVVESSEMSFEEMIHHFATAYENDDKLYAPISASCAGCEYQTGSNEKVSGFMECWKEQTALTDSDFNKTFVFSLWNFRGKQKCLDEGIFFLADIQKEHLGDIKPKSNGRLSTKERQWLQVEKAKLNDNSAYIDMDGLAKELNSHVYPLHFIDFETSMVAIPFYKGSTPYEQIAFQFSHHVMESDGTVRHESQYISTKKGEFPNFDFVRALKADLEKDKGTIFRFAAHENTVLNQIRTQIGKKTEMNIPDKEELIGFIDSITHDNNTGRTSERDMIDMCQIVKDFYFDPYTQGSNSIKAVLPAVLNRSEFIQKRYSQPIYGKGCEISSLNFSKPQVWIQKDENGGVKSPYYLLPPLFDDIPNEEIDNFITNEDLAGGGAALTAFAKIQFTEMTEIERQHVIDGLLRYCELDTLAMVIIYEYWLDEIKKVQK